MDANEIKIGDAVTYQIGSDFYPFTVIAVARGGKWLTLQADKTYKGVLFTPDANGRTVSVSLRGSGRYAERGQDFRSGTYSVGERRYDMDPSF